MTNKEKRLLLIDLCSRLPYRVRVKQGSWEHTLESINMYNVSFDSSCAIPIPYLRPMSSMTEDEKNEWMEITHAQEWLIIGNLDKAIDWLNEHHFDYRGLIEKGLALEAPEDMYKLS